MSDLLQSEGWEQFQRALGRKTWRVDGVLVIEIPLPWSGSFLYSPRIPFSFSHENEKGGVGTLAGKNPRNFVRGVEQLAREMGTIFCRAEMSEAACSVDGVPFTAPRVLRRVVEPQFTWRVDLTPSEEELLAGMHEKHRYNVRLAQRRGVVVRTGDRKQETGNRGDCEVFWGLLQETVRRQGIATHPRRYYEVMLRELAKRSRQQAAGSTEDTDCVLSIAEQGDTSLAAAIVAYHGDTATYLHGGSSYAYRALMAPHLLHWTAMRDAKGAGLRWYDFGGVEPPGTERNRAGAQESQEHAGPSCSNPPALRSSWSGMTRFKQGFGGETIGHPPTRDLVFHRGWYTLLATLARLRP